MNYNTIQITADLEELKNLTNVKVISSDLNV